jgi:nucleoside-diphosphate-sugar epimerase
VDGVVHLAALLPSRSERDRENTMMVNVGGTENVLRAIREVSPHAHMAYASSVSVYGCTTDDHPPVRVDRPPVYSDFYSESKVRGEEATIRSGITYSILRISGIVFAGLFEFPEVLQYRADQRVEFVCIEDVASAMASAVEKAEARNGVFNIAGGKTWQMTGESYVNRVREAMGVDLEVNFSKECGWFDWYDTSESQRILDYQKTPFDLYLSRLKKVFEELLG